MILTTSPVADIAGPDPVLPPWRALVHGLRDLGYIEGRNLVLERRSAEGRFERFGEIVTELVGRKVDVIVTAGNEAAQAAKRATSVVPIVMANSTNPVEAGIVASLARPGGNVTGLTYHTGPEVEARRLQMLKEVVPKATRIAFVGFRNEWEGPNGTSIRAAAHALGVTLAFAEHTPTSFSDAFVVMTREQPHAMFVARHPAVYPSRQLIAEFAVKHQLPGIYPIREIVDAGGLMSYGVDLPDLFRRAAAYVDKVLKGSKPADLAIQQPTRFEMVINGKTAKSLGLTIPPLLLAQADEVIE